MSAPLIATGPTPGTVAGEMYLAADLRWYPVPRPAVNHVGWAVATLLFLPFVFGWISAINNARELTRLAAPCGHPLRTTGGRLTRACTCR